jgi:hypothetical protein
VGDLVVQGSAGNGQDFCSHGFILYAKNKIVNL